jgi:hypothetical protein
MNKFEDPIQFDLKKQIGEVEMAYSNLMEICQGGPLVGNLTINGKGVDGRFGGPAIFQNGYLYVPAYVNKILGTGFKLSRIDIQSLQIEYFGKTNDIIYLSQIDGNLIYYFTDIGKSAQRSYEL